MFFSKKQAKQPIRLPSSDFSYLKPEVFYFDSACQTLRPQTVIDAEMDYYHHFNACGHRVKYPWGERVDTIVDNTRQQILDLLGKSKQEYTVAFTLNTTYGINLVLHQIDPTAYAQVITSDIEHNSVFLPTMSYAKKHGLKRLVLNREQDGSLVYEKKQLDKSLVLINSTSNIDGRFLLNAQALAQDVHAQGGLLLLDAAQTMGHGPESLLGVDFDALFASAHKMYGPSLGFIVIKKSLVKKLLPLFLGGGTVQDVAQDQYALIENDNELYARLELGLQNFAGIVGLQAALIWLGSWKKEGQSATAYEQELAGYLHEKLTQIPSLTLLSAKHSPVQSFYSDKIDAHQIALILGQRNIMARSGYFCCHAYLKTAKQYPPLSRVSLGLHNTKEQIDFLIDSLRQMLSSL